MTTRTRYRSGDTCRKTDAYRFDGYVAVDAIEIPRLGELEVIVEAGQPFPRIESSKLECWWMPAVEISAAEEQDQMKFDPAAIRMGL
jgi:hypothetical protein